MPISRLTPTYTFTEDRLAQLKQVVPEAFADGRINWETLREALGDYLEDEDQPTERFGLFWPGKRDARRAAAQPPQGALRLAPGEGVNEETTRHVFIEGENLEVLKLLRKAYAGRVKMIYIDPPYNTGNDFVYPDDYSEPVEAYLRRTGQMGEAGETLTTNVRANGRFHSNWLNMMYPRLMLSRGLLRDDGVIFVSIGDDEVANLRALCDEVFGEENCLGCATRIAKKTSNKGTFFAPSKDYVLVYAREMQQVEPFRDAIDDAYESRFKDKDERGNYATVGLYQAALDPRPNQRYWVECPDGSLAIPPGEVFPVEHRDAAWIRPESAKDRVWRWTYAAYLQRKHLLVYKETPRSPLLTPEGSQSRWNIYTKYYLADRLQDGLRPRDYIDDLTNDLGTAALKELGLDDFLEFAKPPQLLARLLGWLSDSDGVCMDFFAGSGTCAHAVLDTNRLDNGSRRFVLVQLPEPCPPDSTAYRAGFKTIAEVGKERIRRVIAGMKQDREGKLDLQDRDEPEDLGFRVYKLGRSQLMRWQPYEGESPEAVQTLFSQFQSPLEKDWDPEALRVEVMLQEGFPLDSRVERLSAFTDNAVDRVTSEWCEHRLFICLDQAIADSTMRALPGAMEEQDIFVCLDSALTDDGKLRLADRCNVHVI